MNRTVLYHLIIREEKVENFLLIRKFLIAFFKRQWENKISLKITEGFSNGV